MNGLSKDKLFSVFLRDLVLGSRSTPFFPWLCRTVGIDLPSEVTRSQSVGLPWTSDGPLAENSDSTQHSLERDIYAADGIRTRSPSQWAVADPRLRPRGHWNRPFTFYVMGYWHYIATQRVHVAVSQYYALSVLIHISTPAAIYLVCLAKLGAAAINTQRTCWMQSDSLTGHILMRLVHFGADWWADHDIAY